MTMEDATIEIHENQANALLPDDSMAQAGRKLLSVDFAQMIQHEHCETPHDVHQMRVALRRMRSVLQLLGHHYKKKSVSDLVVTIKQYAALLGTVRDLDVLMIALETYIGNRDDASSFDPIQAYLMKKRRKAQKRLLRGLGSRHYAEFKHALTKFTNKKHLGPQARSSASPFQVRHVLPILIHEALSRVRAYDTILPTDDVTRLHALRIEFKRLRYIVSHFEPVLGASSNSFIQDLKAIQDHLGSLHDAHVAQQTFTVFVKQSQFESSMEAVQDYLKHLSDTEIHLTNTFEVVWNKFNTRATQRKLSDAILVLR